MHVSKINHVKFSVDIKIVGFATDNIPQFINDLEAFIVQKGYTAKQYEDRKNAERDERASAQRKIEREESEKRRMEFYKSRSDWPKPQGTAP